MAALPRVNGVNTLHCATCFEEIGINKQDVRIFNLGCGHFDHVACLAKRLQQGIDKCQTCQQVIWDPTKQEILRLDEKIRTPEGRLREQLWKNAELEFLDSR